MRSFTTTLVTALLFISTLASAMPNHGASRVHRLRKITARRNGSKKPHCAARVEGPSSSDSVIAGTSSTIATTVAIQSSQQEVPTSSIILTTEQVSPTPPAPTTTRQSTNEPISFKPISTLTTIQTSVLPAEPTSKAPSPPPSAPSTGGLSVDAEESLKWHNVVRRQHNAVDLTWSDSLASAAQTWASKCVFQHSKGSLGPFGENLAAGTSNSYSVEDAVTAWTDEVSQYNPLNPVASHYTQVVWRNTKQVGCAMVSGCTGIFPGSTARYYVCEYSPAGNVLGQFDANVQ